MPQPRTDTSGLGSPSEGTPIALVREDGAPAVDASGRPLGSDAGGAQTSPKWVPLGLAVFGFVVLFFTVIRSLRRNARRRSNNPTPPPRQRIETIRSDAADRALVEGYQSDAVELTQRLAAQLDNKAERLEQLIARAERAIAQLERAEQAGPRLVGSDQPGAPAESLSPLHRRIYALADEGHDVMSIARQLDQPHGQVELVLALRRA